MASLAKIKKGLIEQLEKKGAKIEVYTDLIDDYMYYTKLERQMQKDIKENGLSYEAISATGKSYIKDNPSVKNAIICNKQRLAILAQLDLTTKTVEMECDDKL